MLRNYFIIAYRNLWRNKTFTLVNVLGLAIGISACIQIALYIKDELSFDRYHANSERIYRVEGAYERGGGVMVPASASNFGLAPLLKTAFPEIETYVRLTFGREVIRFGEKIQTETNLCYADSGFFDVFSFQFVKGNPATAIDAPNTMVITETFSKKYFGSADPLGQTMRVGQDLIKITGVIKDMPRASHFHSDAVIAISTVSHGYPDWMKDPKTCGTAHYTYLLLPERYNYQQLQSQLNDFIIRYIGKNHTKFMSLFLQPLQSIHLYSHALDLIEPGNDIMYVYLFGAVALVIVLMACLNYINLTTARSLDRAREIGLRKVTGASKQQLVFQFLGESLLVTLLALALAGLLTGITMPLFNSISGKAIPFTLTDNYFLLLSVIGCSLFLGLLAGIYPAFFMSSFSVIRTLKGNFIKTSHGAGLLRKSFVVIQFCISIVLIISTCLIYLQLNFIREKKLGLDPEHLLTIELTGNTARQYQALKAELLKNHRVLSVTSANNDLTSGGTNWRQYQWKHNSRNDVSIATMDVDEDFIATLDARLLTGRWFSKEHPADTTDSYVINEAAARFLELKDPVNEPLLGSQFNNRNWSDKKGRIIGVVKDFHFASLHQEVKPVVFNLQSSKTGPPIYIWLRIGNEGLPASLQFIKNTWKKFEPEYPMQYSFMDQNIESLYLADQNFLKVFMVFACLAICIACLGIFGLATYTAVRRTKEIGIRKTIGASVTSIVILLSKDFAKLIGLSFVIAIPIAWYMMWQWLQDYAYRVGISFGPFMLSGLLTAVIAFISVSYQSVRAAFMNPVKTLRTE